MGFTESGSSVTTILQSDTATAEGRVRLIRAALDSGDRSTAEYQFITLLQESRESTERWLRRVIAVTPALGKASAYPVCEELRQELAFYLWQRIADPARHEVAWERMYWRALAYAQQHVATSYMCQAGYWVYNGAVKHAKRGVAVPLSDAALAELQAPDVLSAVEIAEMHALVMQLPPKERIAVILRYWQDMRVQDIARVLGCTDRNVRVLLHQARERLGTWYEGPAEAVVAAQGQTSAPPARVAGAGSPCLGE